MRRKERVPPRSAAAGVAVRAGEEARAREAAHPIAARVGDSLRDWYRRLLDERLPGPLLVRLSRFARRTAPSPASGRSFGE